MLGVDTRDTEAEADVLYRIANQVDCRDKDRELCRIQYAAREEAHRNADAAIHAHDGRDEHGCSFSGQTPECHDRSADHADDVQEGILPILLQYSWPGNIRELQNVVEYLANVCDGNPRPEDLPPNFSAAIASVRNRQGKQTVGGETLKTVVMRELAIAARIGQHLGRRSLARNLEVPESQIRHVCQELVTEGEIVLKPGRGGIQLKRSWSEILAADEDALQ